MTVNVPQFTPQPIAGGKDAQRPTLAERFLAVPFSVLDARGGWWRDRKAEWLAIGIKSEVGRAGNLTLADSAQPPSVYKAKNAYEAALGRRVTWPEFTAANPGVHQQSGTSVFDPVLCELVYRWFSAPGHLVVDPFAGGSVRGAVAAFTGRRYQGVDLRGEQVQANRDQWGSFGGDEYPMPVWHVGDGAHVRRLCGPEQADLVFSCPPYGDLERYSDDPADLSTMRYAAFLNSYRRIIKESVAMLRQDRFAAFVVGDYRDSKGLYRGFVSDTIAAFRDAGAHLYNEAILVTQAGSLPIRLGKQFEATRKMGKTHQQLLVFVKGDPKKATLACGAVR
jgi:hypothetical protein